MTTATGSGFATATADEVAAAVIALGSDRYLADGRLAHGRTRTHRTRPTGPMLQAELDAAKAAAERNGARLAVLAEQHHDWGTVRTPWGMGTFVQHDRATDDREETRMIALAIVDGEGYVLARTMHLTIEAATLAAGTADERGKLTSRVRAILKLAGTGIRQPVAPLKLTVYRMPNDEPGTVASVDPIGQAERDDAFRQRARVLESVAHAATAEAAASVLSRARARTEAERARDARRCEERKAARLAAGAIPRAATRTGVRGAGYGGTVDAPRPVDAWPRHPAVTPRPRIDAPWAAGTVARYCANRWSTSSRLGLANGLTVTRYSARRRAERPNRVAAP